MKKRKVTVKATEDYAVVVAPIMFWDHLETIFQDFHDREPDPEIAQEWQECIDHVSYWVEKTKDRRMIYKNEEY